MVVTFVFNAGFISYALLCEIKFIKKNDPEGVFDNFDIEEEGESGSDLGAQIVKDRGVGIDGHNGGKGKEQQQNRASVDMEELIGLVEVVEEDGEEEKKTQATVDMEVYGIEKVSIE